MRFAAEGQPDGVDARRLADLADALLDRGAHGIVAANDVVVVDHVIGQIERRWDRRHVDQRIATGEGR